MKREAPAELAAKNEKAKRKKREAAEAADAASAAASAAAAAVAAAAAAATEKPGPPEGEEDDAATLRRRLAEMRDAWAAPRRGRGLSGAAWVAASKGAAAAKQEEKEGQTTTTTAVAAATKNYPPPRVARVAPARSKLAPRMGFHHRGLQYLHPEEAAFLVDRGDLVLAVGVAASKKDEEEDEEEKKKSGGGGALEPPTAAAASAVEAAKPDKPCYPPPPPAALEGESGSARALSVQEAVSLSVSESHLFFASERRTERDRKKKNRKKKAHGFSEKNEKKQSQLSSGVLAGAHQLYSHLMRAGYVVRRNPPVWYLDNSKELSDAWRMGRGWRGSGDVDGDVDGDHEEERDAAAPAPAAAKVAHPLSPSGPSSSSLIPLTASEVRKAKRARAAVDAKMARLYGTWLEGGSGASWESLKRKKQEDKRQRQQGQGQQQRGNGGNNDNGGGETENDLPRSRRWWPAPGAPGSWLPPVDGGGGSEEGGEKGETPSAAAAAASGRGRANGALPSSRSSSSFSHAPAGLLRLRPFPETPRRSPTRRASGVLAASSPAFAVHRCSANFARRRPAAPATVARLAPRAGPSAAPPSADALTAAEGEVARDSARAAAEAAKAAAAEAAKAAAAAAAPAAATEATPAPSSPPVPVPVIRWAVPRSGGVSYFGFHKVRLAHI